MAARRPVVDLTPLLFDPGLQEDPGPIVWHELFGNYRPVELEIGSGKGLFLVNAASSNCSHNFLGIELARKYARLAAEKLARKELTNAKIWRGDARIVVGRLVPDASLRAVHVYFPDPWWKKRHKKRRVFTADLVAQIERALEPGGVLRVASDVEDYFTRIQELIAANPNFVAHGAAEAETAEQPLEYLTNFERKYRIEGRPIFRANYARR